MTSSNRDIFRVTGPLCGEFSGHQWIHAQKPVTRNFDVFFYLRPNKQLSKQSRGWWFETPTRSLWRQCSGVAVWRLPGSQFEHAREYRMLAIAITDVITENPAVSDPILRQERDLIWNILCLGVIAIIPEPHLAF